MTNTKKGKAFCPEAKGIIETTIEQAFLESYKILCHNNKDVMNELLKRIEDTLCFSNSGKELSRLGKDISALEQKRKKLVDMHLDGIIDKETYKNKYHDMTAELSKLNDAKAEFQDTASREANIKIRIADFRRVLEHNEVLTEFDRYVFESIIDKVIVGGVDNEGSNDPSMLTFIYKTGFTNSVNGNDHKPERKNAKSKNKLDKLCSNTSTEVNSLYSDNSDDTCGNGGFAGMGRSLDYLTLTLL